MLCLHLLRYSFVKQSLSLISRYSGFNSDVRRLHTMTKRARKLLLFPNVWTRNLFSYGRSDISHFDSIAVIFKLGVTFRQETTAANNTEPQQQQYVAINSKHQHFLFHPRKRHKQNVGCLDQTTPQQLVNNWQLRCQDAPAHAYNYVTKELVRILLFHNERLWPSNTSCWLTVSQ